MEINKKNIPSEYMISLQGKMNKGVFNCFNPRCDRDVSHRQSEYSVIEDIIGFADSNWGKMVVWKCKSCGEIYFFHLRENDELSVYDYVSRYHEYKTTGQYTRY